MNPDGYWPKGMEESAKSHSMSEFERLIYPIWRGIEEKDRTEELKLSVEEVADQDVLLECLTLHKQDAAIYSSGIKPALESVDQVRMAELRRKASRASGNQSQ